MKKTHIVHFIKRPSEKDKRTSFSILAKHTPPLDRKRYTKYEDLEGRLASLNQAFKAGVPVESIEKGVKALCEALNVAQRKKEQSQWIASSDNLKIYDEYWAAEFADKKTRRPERARDTILWALNLIGPTPVLAEIKELQKVVDERCKGHPRRQRRACGVLNGIRRFYGLTKKRLNRVEKVPPKFLYLTESEFLKAMQFVEEWRGVSAETLKAFFYILFYSGVRPGEAFALKRQHLYGTQLKVLTQIDRDEIECKTKNGKIRTTFLNENAHGHFQIWLEAKDKWEIDRNGICRYLKAVCQKAFPHDPSKWITPKDLRHSYAVFGLTQLQLNLEFIAKLLGNTRAVCEEYYLAFEQNDALLDFVAERARNLK